jgi:hypothetical protein
MINSLEVVMKSLVWFITGASRGFGLEIAESPDYDYEQMSAAQTA